MLYFNFSTAKNEFPVLVHCNLILYSSIGCFPKFFVLPVFRNHAGKEMVEPKTLNVVL